MLFRGHALMPSKTVSDAFEARLATWPHIGDCPFVDLQIVSVVPKPPFIEIEYPVAIEERISVGSPAVFRETGGARFVITVASFKDGWKAQVLGWIEELRDLYRAPFFDGLETRAASPAALDDRNKNGNRYRVPFVVTFVFDSMKITR
jgi:hypothetical protein